MPKRRSVFYQMKPADLEEVRQILKDIVADNSRAGEVIRRHRSLVKKGGSRFYDCRYSRAVIRDVMQLVHSDANLRNIRL